MTPGSSTVMNSTFFSSLLHCSLSLQRFLSLVCSSVWERLVLFFWQITDGSHLACSSTRIKISYVVLCFALQNYIGEWQENIVNLPVNHIELMEKQKLFRPYTKWQGDEGGLLC